MRCSRVMKHWNVGGDKLKICCFVQCYSPKIHIKIHNYTLFHRHFTCKYADKQAPSLVYCPGTIYQLIEGNEEAVTWTEPEFTDNVKVTRVESSKKSGDIFQELDTNVIYTAYDEAGNSATCSFLVSLKRKSFAGRIYLFVWLPVCCLPLLCFVRILCRFTLFN